jgi:hypothetical protein
MLPGRNPAELVEGALVMTGPPLERRLSQRVVFSEFTDESFLWASKYSQDNGETWSTVMRIRAKRVD